MPIDSDEKKQLLLAAANGAAVGLDADILVFNYEILPPVDFDFIGRVTRRNRRKNVILVLVTEGGNADSAFRMMRVLQSSYERVTVAVPGWCKSAGTLMCIGAHELQMGSLGELGPLDVQIVKVDEMDEQKSGLVAEAAFEKMQQEAYKFFMSFVRDLGGSEYRVSLRTAFEIATKMTSGVVQPIFDKLEPVTIGEDFRSNRLAAAYAERLYIHSKNLKRSREFDALEALLSGYQSHGFVIDFKEASDLFRNVKPLSPQIVKIVGLLGANGIFPRSRRQEQPPLMEFLSDAPGESKQGEGEASAAKGVRKRSRRKRAGVGQLPRPPKEGGGAAAPRRNGAGGE